MLHVKTVLNDMARSWNRLAIQAAQFANQAQLGSFFATMPMAGRSYVIFDDIERKLDVLRVERTKCARKGRYSVRRLIEKYGRKANMMKWKEQLNGDCPRREARSMARTLRSDLP
jgi:hypothetical protein